jgi:hypothetical protein
MNEDATWRPEVSMIHQGVVAALVRKKGVRNPFREIPKNGAFSRFPEKGS